MTMWAVKGAGGQLRSWSVRDSREDAIAAFLEGIDETVERWFTLSAKGYQVVKVTVEEVKP